MDITYHPYCSLCGNALKFLIFCLKFTFVSLFKLIRQSFTSILLVASYNLIVVGIEKGKLSEQVSEDVICQNFHSKKVDSMLMSMSWIQITSIEIIQQIKIFSVARLNFINYAKKDFLRILRFLGLFLAKLMKLISFCGLPYLAPISMYCCIIYYQISSNGGRSTRKTFYFQLLGYLSLFHKQTKN